MNRPDDKAENLPEELASAYRALPPTGPSTALDARVRTAVVAEVGATQRPRPHGIAHFSRRRVPLAPLATAAALLLAIGTGYLVLPWFHGPEELHQPRDAVVPGPPRTRRRPPSPAPPCG